MFDIDNFQEIWMTITRNKFRSFLTGFGVFWGIFMLIILMGLGNAFQGGIMKNFEAFASNSCFFFSNRTSEAYKGYRNGRQWDMNNRDLILIREKARSVEYLSPMLFGASPEKNAVRNNKYITASVRGVYPEYFEIEKQTVLKGRTFNEMDIKDSRKVCLIGTEIEETLFGKSEDPIGQYIRVNGIYFQVAGVISPKSKISIGGDVETSVFLPFNTMQRAFNQGDIIHSLGATAKPGYPAEVVEAEIKSILKTAHDISPSDEKAIGSFNVEKEFKLFDTLFTGIDVLILIVGIFALASGVIGISNIMMVTVRERTREIGVRRAIGAKPAVIMKQIMAESLVLTVIAGISGIVAGTLLLEAIHQAMSGNIPEGTLFIPPFVTIGSAMVSFTSLIIAGLLSGVMPAYRALRIKAIDAIRDE